MTKSMKENIQQIIEWIKTKSIIDYDGTLCVYFMGKPTDFEYSIDGDRIVFPMASYKLTEWLQGLIDSDDDAWTVEWANK